MTPQLLHIKNMVCRRCVMAVEDILKDLHIPYLQVQLGEIQLSDPIADDQLQQLSAALEQIGFELFDDRKSALIEKTKQIVTAQARGEGERSKLNLSALLSDQLHYDYNYLSGLFSEAEGTTIEKFYIAQRTERVKELLVYNELSLSEIAFNLGYSSVAHLSNQFKKVTGLSPSHFRNIGAGRRKPVDRV